MAVQKILPLQINTTGATDGQVFAANGTGGMYWSNGTQTIGIAAFAQANVAVNIAQSAFAQANTGSGTVVGAAFDKANSANYFAYVVNSNTVAAFAQANVAVNIAQAAFAQANAGSGTANATSQTFTGNGSNTAFNLSSNVSNDKNIIVSVNGLLQIPTTHYSLSGNTLTFTSAPRANSSIEARVLEGVVTSSSNGSISGGASRTTITANTASLANLATGNVTATGYKSYVLLKIQTSCEAWVRIYTDSSSRTSDASRTIGTDPIPGSGVIAEVLTTTGYLTQLVTPAIFGFNNDATPTANVYMAVTNYNVSTQAVTVTLTLTQMEV